MPSIFVKPPASTDGLPFHQEKGRASIDSDMEMSWPGLEVAHVTFVHIPWPIHNFKGSLKTYLCLGE